VVATWNGGNTSSSVQIYIDGVEVDNADNASGTFSKVYAGSDVPLSVGAQLSAGYPIGAQFFGNQSDVRMYNRALSVSEIGQLYTNGVVNLQNPLPVVQGLHIISP